MHVNFKKVVSYQGNGLTSKKVHHSCHKHTWATHSVSGNGLGTHNGFTTITMQGLCSRNKARILVIGAILDHRTQRSDLVPFLHICSHQTFTEQLLGDLSTSTP